MQKTLLAAAAGFLAVSLFGAVSVQAEEPVKEGAWQPSAGWDVFQPGYNLSGSSRQFHLTLSGVHVSLLRAGRFRFPTAGLDFQARVNQADDWDGHYSWLGVFLLSSGVAYIVDEKMYEGEWGLHFKGQYALRADPDPRIGRLGITVGAYVKF